MTSYSFNLPRPFGWKINGVGHGAELVDQLQRIMQLSRMSEGASAGITVMPRSHYDVLPEAERNRMSVCFSRKAVRLFRQDHSAQWFLVIPENILFDRNTRIVLMWLILYPFLLQCLTNGALPVHASSAARNGKSIMVPAAGDTGKTTTVRRLKAPWLELGDDSALLLPRGQGYELHPLPTWSEFIYGTNPHSSWDFEKGTALDGIFFLQQADQDRAEALSVPVATMRLYSSALEAMGYWKKQFGPDLKTIIFETAEAIARLTPAFILHATLHGDVQKSIENVLTEK